MIDIGEKWAAHLGVEAALTRKIPRITNADIKAVNEMESDIADLVRKLLGGSEFVTWPSVPLLDKISEQVKAKVDEESIVSLIEKLPDEAKMPYKQVALRQITAVAQAIPRSSMLTLAGPLKLRPTDFEVFAFEGEYRAIDDPRYVINLMSDAALLKTQSDMATLVFPTMSKFFSDAIMAGIEDAKTKEPANGDSPGYQVPWKAEISIRDWMGIPMIIAPYQATFFEQKKNDLASGKPQPSSSGVSPESKASISAAQSAMYRSIGQ